MKNFILINGCPICGKQSLSASNPYCKDHVNIIGKSDIKTTGEVVINKYASVEELKCTKDELSFKMETLDKQNIAMTKDMRKNLYELVMKDTKRDIRNVYCSLNWFQKLLWRILGLNRLWLNDEYDK